jgi:Cu2+-containing amine oxidase
MVCCLVLSGKDEKKDGRIIYNTTHAHTHVHIFLSRLNAVSRLRFNINTTFSVVRA